MPRPTRISDENHLIVQALYVRRTNRLAISSSQPDNTCYAGWHEPSTVTYVAKRKMLGKILRLVSIRVTFSVRTSNARHWCRLTLTSSSHVFQEHFAISVWGFEDVRSEATRNGASKIHWSTTALRVSNEAKNTWSVKIRTIWPHTDRTTADITRQVCDYQLKREFIEWRLTGSEVLYCAGR